jgi:hypothetical protein
MPTPALPQLDQFRSATLTHRTGELFNPPGLTNFHGCLQAAPDILAIQHLTFAPYSTGESWLGTLTLNECCLHTAGQPIEFRWRPDRIERWMHSSGFDLRSTTVMGVRAQTATVGLHLTNTTDRPLPARLRVLTGEGVIHSVGGWKTPYSPRECPAISTTPWDGTPPAALLARNRHAPTPDNDGLLYTSRTSPACAVQAASPRPDRITRRWLEFDWQLAPGESRELFFFTALGAEREALLAQLADWRRAPAAALAAAEADWQAEIAAVFTPGNSRYSGHVPVLRTTSADLRAIYLNAVITVVYFKREHPLSRHGRTYTTLMPRYWVTTSFINDWSLTALLLVMLDPACVRSMLELWLERDIHQHFGTEYVSGESAGNWYSCNDHAMARLITTYVRVTGDFAWLQHRVGARTVLGHLRACATHYRSLTGPSGLADYGDRNSLLECVGTYTHEVASLNAANVWILRETATLLAHLGEAAEADACRREAAALVPRVQQLYVAGGGYWNCRQPDGTLQPVRHVWDFIHTLNCLHTDLPPAQIAEMVGFFQRELLTPAWLAALSPLDEDIGFSLRPDHQWNGSYPGWVALAASALLKAGRDDLLRQWLPGLARTANQGPYCQAHFVENYAAPVEGGARKAPTEWPYITDWTVLCAGGFFETVLLDLFGLDFGYARLEAKPRLGTVDPTAALENVPYQGKLHHITA